MQLEIITPETKLFSGNIKLVKLPGSKGSFEMLKHHAPIISTLEKGTIKVVELDGKELFFEIKGGVIEGSNNKVIILAE